MYNIKKLLSQEKQTLTHKIIIQCFIIVAIVFLIICIRLETPHFNYCIGV
jgi:hypothetical protein